MKELFLIRHAKSDWGSEFLKDIDRPLNERGYSDAYSMSKWFLKNKKLPDCILSSPATRALNTALIFVREFEFEMKKFHLEPNLYEANVQTLYKIIMQQNSDVDSLMLFCHNPGITDLCNQLTDDIFIDNVPTCGIVNIKFEIKDWKELDHKKGTLGYFQFPKDFRNSDS